MKRQRNIFLSLMLVGILLFSIVYLNSYVIDHMEHNCSGDDCAICFVIHIAETFMKQMAGAAFGCIALICGIIGVICITSKYQSSISERTPIKDKVRLND